MKVVATLALTALLTSMTNAEAPQIDVSSLTCRQFVQSDPSTVNLILTWFMGFYAEVQSPQVIDLRKLDSLRDSFMAFCKQQPNFRMTTAAEGLFAK